MNMTKMYVKDESGKYKLVDRDQKEMTSLSGQRMLSLEELDARLRRVEGIVLDPRL